MLKTNTHLRVPPGFGALLEGLAREILRDRPKDIPKYAAEYFESLLKNRQESGTDPREWTAKLEDKYESNQAYKTSEVASKLTVFNKKTAENYSGQSEHHVSMATSKNSHADDAHLAKSEKEESSPIITQAESTDGPSVASRDPKASTHSQSGELSNEINNSTASSQNNSYSERHDVQLMKEEAMAAQGSESKHEDDDSQLADTEEDVPGSVNISPTNLEEETADAVSVMEEDAEQKEVLQSNEMRPESRVSQIEITEQRREEARNGANHVVLTDAALDDNQDKSLLEIDFEDVPENLQTMGENELNMESVKMTTNDTILSQDEAAQGNERQEDDAKNEVNSNHDNYREENIGMDTGDLPTDKSKEDNLQHGDTDNIDNEKTSQMDNFENSFDFTRDTTLMAEDTKGAEKEDQPEIEHQRSTGDDAKNDVTQLDSNVKIMEKCGNDMSEDDEEQQQQSLDKYLLKELQSEEEEEDEHAEEEVSDPEVNEGPSSCEQDSINPDLDEKRADTEDIHLQEDLQDTPHSEGDTNGMQEECSRPQEEEDIMDIPLDDPEANRAAAKIQAGFRGHMTRKKMKPEDKTEGEERQEDRGQ